MSNDQRSRPSASRAYTLQSSLPTTTGAAPAIQPSQGGRGDRTAGRKLPLRPARRIQAAHAILLGADDDAVVALSAQVAGGQGDDLVGGDRLHSTAGGFFATAGEASRRSPQQPPLRQAWRRRRGRGRLGHLAAASSDVLSPANVRAWGHRTVAAPPVSETIAWPAAPAAIFPGPLSVAPAGQPLTSTRTACAARNSQRPPVSSTVTGCGLRIVRPPQAINVASAARTDVSPTMNARAAIFRPGTISHGRSGSPRPASRARPSL